MKEKIFFTCCLLFSIHVVNAQQNDLDEDQNPNYMISQTRYTENADSIKTMLAATAVTLYTPYDPDAVRKERRHERREWRHQERMVADNYYYGGSTWGWGYRNNWYNNGYNWNYRHNNRWYSPWRGW